MNLFDRARIWAWALWHTRPGHNNYGVLIDPNGVYCAVCYAKAPEPKEKS